MTQTAPGITDGIRRWADGGQPQLRPSVVIGARSRDGRSIICPSQSQADATVVMQPAEVAPGVVRMRALDDDEPTPDGPVRLMGHCRSTSCAYWNDSCQLGILLSRIDPVGPGVRDCDVRETCRWHLENGPAACGNCLPIAYLMPHS